MTAKTKQYKNSGAPETDVLEEEVVVKTPKVGYESLSTPNGMTNDAMSGWREMASGMNNQYGGDILNFGTSKEFGKLDSTKQAQYYTDLGNYQSLYQTLAGYDADYATQAKAAKEAEEYANTRRMLMQRYMPETLAAMGYANTGAASDAVLRMNNAYDNYAIDAKAKAAQNQADLLSKYRNSAMEWSAERNAEKQAVLDEQKANYDAYIAGLYQDGALDWNQVQADVKLGNLTEEQVNALKEASRKNSAGDLTTTEDVKHTITYDNGKTAQIIKEGQRKYDAFTNADTILNNIDVKNDEEQTAYVQRILKVSQGWDSSMNGTFVEFNQGKIADKYKPGTIFVYYDGIWYPTTLSQYTTPNKVKVYDEKSFYSKFGEGA